MGRWTKYAKRGFYIEKPETEEESLKARAARMSRKATSITLKCSVSKELLENLEKGLDKLDLEADIAMSKLQEKFDDVVVVSTECATDTLKGTISFRVPHVIKGPKNKRLQSAVEKNTTKKKKKSTKKKGIHPTLLILFPERSNLYINYFCSQEMVQLMPQRIHMKLLIQTN